MKKINLLFLFGLLLNFNLSTSQSIFVNTEEQTSSYSIEEVQRLTFSENQMFLRLFDGTEFSFDLSTLANYRYGNGETMSTEDFLDQANAWDLTVYPNPSKDMVNIGFNLPDISSVTYQVFDIKGQELIKKSLAALSAGKNNIELSLGHLPSGTYLLKLGTDQVMISHKLIKN